MTIQKRQQFLATFGKRLIAVKTIGCQQIGIVTLTQIYGACRPTAMNTHEQNLGFKTCLLFFTSSFVPTELFIGYPIKFERKPFNTHFAQTFKLPVAILSLGY